MKTNSRCRSQRVSRQHRTEVAVCLGVPEMLPSAIRDGPVVWDGAVSSKRTDPSASAHPETGVGQSWVGTRARPKKFKKRSRIGETPPKTEKQSLHYSGKNIVIETTKKKRVSYLSQPYPGKTHDKNVADAENISYPKHIRLHKGTGYQGHEPKVRVRVEHAIAGVKRSRTVKELLQRIDFPL